MPFLSSFLNKPVKDARGNRIGKLRDMIVSAAESPYPKIKALIIGTRDGDVLISWNQIKQLEEEVTLKVGTDKIRPYHRQERDICLVTDVLDMQVIDAEGKKLRRVNDVQLEPVGRSFALMSLEIGSRGYLRRLGVEPAAESIGLGQHGYIPWDVVDTGRSDGSGVRLKVSRYVIGRFHPADTLEIANQLKKMDAAHAADLLQGMEPEDAADVLKDLASKKAKVILDKMKPEQSKKVRELFEYYKKTEKRRDK